MRQYDKQMNKLFGFLLLAVAFGVPAFLWAFMSLLGWGKFAPWDIKMLGMLTMICCCAALFASVPVRFLMDEAVTRRKIRDLEKEHDL